MKQLGFPLRSNGYYDKRWWRFWSKNNLIDVASKLSSHNITGVPTELVYAAVTVIVMVMVMVMVW